MKDDLESKVIRNKLKKLGLDYHKIAMFFGYSSASFANSTRRELIEKGVFLVVKYIQEGGYTTKKGVNDKYNL